MESSSLGINNIVRIDNECLAVKQLNSQDIITN